MPAQMGMKVEAWEDGQVNIGVAVCPPKNISNVTSYNGKGAYTTVPSKISEGCNTPSLLSKRNTPNCIIPKSAFIIRPPENYESQGGINITYAHQIRGKSDLIITLNSEDQGQQEKIRSIQQQILQRQQYILSSELATHETEIERMENISKVHKTEVASANNKVKQEAEELVLYTMQDMEESSAHELPRKVNKEATQETSSISIPREASSNHKSPQEALNTVEKTEKAEGEKERSPTGELTSQRKSGSSMKRVSWVEDCETFAEGNNTSRSRNNSFEESKNESGRKSNGTGTSNRSSPMKKLHNGYSSPPNDAASLIDRQRTITIAAAAAGGGKTSSGDKSRIPLIAANGDYPPNCDYYRRKMLRECLCNDNTTANPPNLAENWYGYTSLQRYAGQKVVKKIAAEQKRLEEDISNRRKTEIWILGSDMDDYLLASPALPLRKKTTRLKPIQIVKY